LYEDTQTRAGLVNIMPSELAIGAFMIRSTVPGLSPIASDTRGPQRRNRLPVCWSVWPRSAGDEEPLSL